jgi:hypothetical protein
MVRGKEVVIGFIPENAYNVLIHKVEVGESKSTGFQMVTLEAEIVGPDVVEYAGRQYKTAGATGRMYVMLKNKNGVDDALNRLSQPLEKLGLLQQIPDGQEYGAEDVIALIKQLELKRISMIVKSKTEYVTDSNEKNASYDIAKARRDESGEPIIRRYNTDFSFDQVKALLDEAF